MRPACPVMLDIPPPPASGIWLDDHTGGGGGGGGGTNVKTHVLWSQKGIMHAMKNVCDTIICTLAKKILVFELWGTDVLSSSGSISFSQFGQRREKKERIPGSDSARPHVNFCAFSFLFFFGATHFFFPFQTKHSLDRGIKMSSPWIDGNMEEQKWHRHFHFLPPPTQAQVWEISCKKIRFLMPLIDTCVEGVGWRIFI